MQESSHVSTTTGAYDHTPTPNRTSTSRLPIARPQHFAPSPPPGLGPRRWLPNEDGHICEFTNVFRRCPHCSWSARMHNPWENTHYDPPADSEPRYIEPGLHPPPSWPTDIPWTVPYGVVERKQHPEGFRRFDPTATLWWSQWEIVFARAEMNLSDTEICALYRYRWALKDPSTAHMQPHHVPEILALLHDNHPFHAHAFWFRGREREAKAREEWQVASDELRVARDEEWEVRCRGWEAGVAGGEEWRVRSEELGERIRTLDERTKELEGKKRRLEAERWELAPMIVAVREEFGRDLVRAIGVGLGVSADGW